MMAKKNSKHEGLRYLAKNDVIAGAFLLVLGGLIYALPNASWFLYMIASVLVILGVITAGFGIGDYVRS
jgi:uncharacterized ion transporter superfamily protein YfcC